MTRYLKIGRIDRVGVNWALPRPALWLLLLAIVPSTLAKAQGVTATINRSEATVQDPLILTVTVEGSRSARPQLPDLSDFEIRSRGQSTQMSLCQRTAQLERPVRISLDTKASGSLFDRRSHGRDR